MSRREASDILAQRLVSAADVQAVNAKESSAHWLTHVSTETTARLIADPRDSGSCNRCSMSAGN
jgi:hypothetical protein